jgi:hypothetical protein
VGVAHCGGIWDTTHYTSEEADNASFADVNAGDLLNVTWNLNGRLTNYDVINAGTDDWKVHETALVPMFDLFTATGTTKYQAVGIVIKGVSAAKAESTHGGQTMYPIRFKLLV